MGDFATVPLGPELSELQARIGSCIEVLGSGCCWVNQDAGYDIASPYEKVVATVTTDFFNAELYHLAGGIHQMQSDGTIPGTAVFAPSCPGPPPPLK